MALHAAANRCFYLAAPPLYRPSVPAANRRPVLSIKLVLSPLSFALVHAFTSFVTASPPLPFRSTTFGVFFFLVVCLSPLFLCLFQH